MAHQSTAFYMLHALYTPALSLAVSTAVLVVLLRARGLALDHPNERSLHAQPVPRTGGIAIVLGCLPAMAIFFPESRALCSLAAALAIVSAIDDWKNLSVLVRLAAHFAAAAAWILQVAGSVSALEASLLVLAMVWLTNLYNFMDGSDGLAGGMAVIGFGAYAVCAWLAGYPSLASASASIALAATPFLMVNFHPAHIFMGDAGSVTLGFLAGALGILGWHQGAWSASVPLVVFSPFIVDATITLGRRALSGQRVWEAHREHFYQKLVRMGFGHRNTALMEYGVMLAAAAGAVSMVYLSPAAQIVVCAAWLALLCIAGGFVDLAWNRHSRTGSEA